MERSSSEHWAIMRHRDALVCLCEPTRVSERALREEGERERLSISSLGQLLFGSLLLKCSQWAGYTKACSIVLNSCALHALSLSLSLAHLFFQVPQSGAVSEISKSKSLWQCSSLPKDTHTHTLRDLLLFTLSHGRGSFLIQLLSDSPYRECR